MNDQQIIDLLQHLDECLSTTWPSTLVETPYKESATHEQVLRVIKALESRSPIVTTIEELERQGIFGHRPRPTGSGE